MKFFAFALLALTAVVGVSAHIPPAVTEAAGQLGIALTGLTNSTSAIVAAFTKNVLDDVEQVSSSIIQLQTVLTKKLSDTLGGGLVSGVATSALSALVSAANNLLQSVSTDLAKIFTGPLAVLNAPINSLNSKIQSLLNGTGTTVGAVLKCAENDLAQDLGIVNNVTANVQDLVNKLIANYKKQTDDILTPFTTKLNKVILDLANFSLGRIPAIVSKLLNVSVT